MKKKTVMASVMAILVGISAAVLFGCAPKTYIARYSADENGYIEGGYIQTVEIGEYTSPVTAVPKSGYRFLKWEDNGSTNPVRTDLIGDCDVNARALFAKQEYSVAYITDGNGTIEGEAQQSVKYDEESTPVTAVPKAGYRFLEWQDGVTEPTRTDAKIKEDKTFTALFTPAVNTYTFNYHYATADADVESIELSFTTFEQAQLPVPQRELYTFGGWYADADCTAQVADSEGKVTAEKTFFDGESRTLHAKWIPNDYAEFFVLMVYVQEIHATLDTIEGNAIAVDYVMTETERKICRMATERFQKQLDEIFGGLVKFTVNEYFTKEPLGKENIQWTGGTKATDYAVFAEDIPEVAAFKDKYDSVIVTFCMNDFDHLLHIATGMGHYKSAVVYFEGLVGQTIINGRPLESLLDAENKEWDRMVDTYLHEFTHTIEQGLAVYEYHKVMEAYYRQEMYDSLEIVRLYLTNQAIVDGEKVGIPFPFWKGEVYTVSYDVQYSKHGPMGYVEGDVLLNGLPQRVPKGYNANSVTAVAVIGYKFSGWSDGVMTATRRDKNITEDFTATALFEPCIYDVVYLADEGGTIMGNAKQKVVFRTYSETITAVASPGYIFKGWSDGYPNAERRDYIQIAQAESNGLQVTAKFEKI